MKTEHFNVATSTLLVFITVIAVPLTTNGQQGHYKMQALGRTAQLGEFYDARTEQFLGQSVFRQRLPSTLIATTEVPWMNSRFDTTNKQSEKRKMLELKVNLYMSIMMGMIKIDGGCSYLKNDKDSATSITSYLTYETRTVKDTVDLYMDDIRSLISDEDLSSVDATHILTSIEYGADAVVEFQHSGATFQDTEKITAFFSAEVKALFGLVGASARADISVENHYLTNKDDVKINIFGDIPAVSATPQSFQEAMDYIKEIPVLTKNYNNGKGKPVVYTLFPVDAIRRKFFIRSRFTSTLKEVDPTLLHHLLLLTDQMDETKLLLKDLTADIKAFKECITTPDFLRASQLNQEYLSFSEKFKGEIRKALIAVRSGEQSNDFLVDIIVSYRSNPLSATNVKIQLRQDFGNISEKLRIYKTFILSEKADYWRSLSSLALINPGKNVYVLAYSTALVQKNTTAWLASSSLFLRLAKIPSNHMVVLDCDFPSANCDLEKVRLSQYRTGQLISDDATRDLKFLKTAGSMRIPAFGRKEPIGALYNSKTGKFVSSSILQQKIFDVKEDMEYIQESKILFPKTFREKMEILQIPPDVAVQVFTEIVECRTSCEFIRRPLATNKITGVYLHTIQSNVDTALDLVLAEGLDLTAVLESGATHFVHQVIYGARTLAQVEIPKSKTSCDENLLKLDLEDLQKLTEVAVKNSTEESEIQMDFNMKSNGSMQVYSDVLELNIDFKEDKNGLKLFMKNLQQTISSMDDAKGVPITYVLQPLQNFELYFGTLKPHIFEQPILNTSDYQRIARSYEEIMEAQAEIASWSTEFYEQKPCVLHGEEKVLEGLKLQFEHQFALWRSDLKTAIDEGKPREYFEIFLNLTDHYKISKAAILHDLETSLGWTMDKIKLIEAGKQNNIGYLGRITIDLTGHASLQTHIFYLKREFKLQVELWSKNLFLFYSLNLPKNRLFFLDCDFGDALCDEVSGPVVHEYVKGVRTSGDFSRPLPTHEVLESSEEKVQMLEDFTQYLVEVLEEIKLNATAQFDGSLTRTKSMAVEDCGASREKLLEDFDRQICQPAPSSCP